MVADHVSFFRARALPGKRQAVIDQFDKWEKEHKAKATGFVRSILVASNSDPDELMGAVRWDTTENYFANAGGWRRRGGRPWPEQDAWYRGLRANLAADPEWFDGTLVKEYLV